MTTIEPSAARREHATEATDAPEPTTTAPSVSTRSPRLIRRLGIRSRILAWFVVLLGAALLTVLLVTRAVLVNGIDTDADVRLNNDAGDFRVAVNDAHLEQASQLTKAMDDVMDHYLEGLVARPDQAELAIVNGRPYAVSAGSPVALDHLPEVGTWAGLLESHNGTLDTAAGPARWLAVPIVSQNKTLATMVIVDFVGGRHDQVNDTVRSVGIILGVVFLAAAFAAFGSAGRALRPLRRLSATAASVGGGNDLDARIPVSGHDEVTDLGESFNGMMARLQQAFDSQKQFLDNAGHELRTPLTIVRGHLELLDLEDPDEREATASLVLDELDRMERLVEELRILARCERPDFLRPDHVDIGGLTRDLLLKAVTLADREFDIDAAADVEIVADRSRLTEAAMNLVQNAVDMTNPGDTIAIGTSCDGSSVKLWVRDSGPGIPAELQPLLFEKTDTPDELKRQGGTGLGIPLALAIARAHGGTLGVSSRAGDGATFVMIIPATGLRVPDLHDPSRWEAAPAFEDRRLTRSLRHEQAKDGERDDTEPVDTEVR
jgi:signal transduction histidine kinase